MTPEVQTIRPGVAGIVFDDRGRILLHRRRIGEGWAPPSGSVEPGEDVVAALHRELREETSLTVEMDRFVGLYSDPAFQVVQYPDRRDVHFVTSVFACHRMEGTLHGSDEGTDWRWVVPDSLPNDLLPYAREWLADARAEHSQPVVR